MVYVDIESLYLIKIERSRKEVHILEKFANMSFKWNEGVPSISPYSLVVIHLKSLYLRETRYSFATCL